MSDKPAPQIVADAIAQGLGGFLQLAFAKRTEALVNELRLQVEAFEILSGLFPNRTVVVGDVPPNWRGLSDERMDLGVVNKKAWSMVGEVKYFRGVTDVGCGRENVLQDAARLASAAVSAGSPRLLIVCQHSHGKDDLWKKGPGRIGCIQRAAAELFPRKQGPPHQIATTCGAIDSLLPTWQDRTPDVVRLAPPDAVKVTLLSKVEFRQKGQSGVIRVWNLERG
jgi:hypothetical protein